MCSTVQVLGRVQRLVHLPRKEMRKFNCSRFDFHISIFLPWKIKARRRMKRCRKNSKGRVSVLLLTLTIFSFIFIYRFHSFIFFYLHLFLIHLSSIRGNGAGIADSEELLWSRAKSLSFCLSLENPSRASRVRAKSRSSFIRYGTPGKI